jgi:hypothetical protein
MRRATLGEIKGYRRRGDGLRWKVRERLMGKSKRGEIARTEGDLSGGKGNDRMRWSETRNDRLRISQKKVKSLDGESNVWIWEIRKMMKTAISMCIST